MDEHVEWQQREDSVKLEVLLNDYTDISELYRSCGYNFHY